MATGLPSVQACQGVILKAEQRKRLLPIYREAMGLWIEDARERGEPVPEDNAQVRLLTLAPALA